LSSIYPSLWLLLLYHLNPLQFIPSFEKRDLDLEDDNSGFSNGPSLQVDLKQASKRSTDGATAACRMLLLLE
jgi:hypothetical protein